MKITCAACGNISHIQEKLGFRDTCPSCDAWLHSCVHCAFWINSQCTEPSAEKERDPEGQNYCEWFVPGTQNAARGTQQEKTEGSREAAEEMWRRLTKK